MNTHCGRSRPFRHEHRWTRSPDYLTRTRWVHGWFIIVIGAGPRWKNKVSFELHSRGCNENGEVVIIRSRISSAGAAMTQALALVCALRHLNLGTRVSHAPPREKRT